MSQINDDFGDDGEYNGCCGCADHLCEEKIACCDCPEHALGIGATFPAKKVRHLLGMVFVFAWFFLAGKSEVIKVGPFPNQETCQEFGSWTHYTITPWLGWLYGGYGTTPVSLCWLDSENDQPKN